MFCVLLPSSWMKWLGCEGDLEFFNVSQLDGELGLLLSRAIVAQFSFSMQKF